MSLFKHPIFLITVVLTAFMAFTFVHNLPHWCANPQGNGNWLVVPFCTK